MDLAIRDIIANIRHYCDKHDINFFAELNAGNDFYYNEIGE
jgi:hypothetical protein